MISKVLNSPISDAVTAPVDLSKILGGQTQILWGQNVVNTDKCMVVPRFWGGAPGCPSQSLRLCARRWFSPQIILPNDKSVQHDSTHSRLHSSKTHPPKILPTNDSPPRNNSAHKQYQQLWFYFVRLERKCVFHAMNWTELHFIVSTATAHIQNNYYNYWCF